MEENTNSSGTTDNHVHMLCPVKSRRTFSDPNRVLQVNEVFKDEFYQVYPNSGIPTAKQGFKPGFPELYSALYHQTG